MDLTQLTTELLQGLGVIVLGMMLVGGRLMLAWLGVKLTTEQAATVDTVAENALDWAISRAGAAIKAKGWDHPDVKSGILQAALLYAQQNADAGMKKAGIDTSSRLASADRLMPVLERSFADAMGKAASSPATPIVRSTP